MASALSLTSCAPDAGIFDNDSRVSRSIVVKSEALLEDRPITGSRYLTVRPHQIVRTACGQSS